MRGLRGATRAGMVATRCTCWSGSQHTLSVPLSDAIAGQFGGLCVDERCSSFHQMIIINIRVCACVRMCVRAYVCGAYVCVTSRRCSIRDKLDNRTP